MVQMSVLVLIGLFFCTLFDTSSARSQSIQTARVEFARGSDGTEIPGSIRGDQIIDYVLGAAAGQTMSVEMTVDNPSAYFNVTAPGAQAAMHIGSTSGNSFTTQIPSTGDYSVRVYLMRNAARRNERANYTISFRITNSGGGQTAVSQGDYADSLGGGPDFWEVAGVRAGDRLNMRAGPSTSHNVTATLANGTVLRNLGCRMSGSQRWCKVEMLQQGGWAGWVAGRYLREATAPGDDNSMQGTGAFDARGRVPCASSRSAPMGSCNFGVVRKGNGTAIMTVFLPGGEERVLHFQSGEPILAEGAGEVTWVRRGDLLMIEVRGRERYEVPDVVLYGG